MDAAGSEGRDPIDDINKINNELSRYSERLANLPQVIAANKTDAIVKSEPEAIDIDDSGELIYDKNEDIDPIERLRKEFEPKGIPVFPLSAVTGEGVDEILSKAADLLDEADDEPVLFASEFDPEFETGAINEPYSVYFDEDTKEYVIEGPRIEKMLGYTNLDSEKGFAFFQRFLKENGILDELKALDIKEGDTVRMYGFAFDYYE